MVGGVKWAAKDFFAKDGESDLSAQLLLLVLHLPLELERSHFQLSLVFQMIQDLS